MVGWLAGDVGDAGVGQDLEGTLNDFSLATHQASGSAWREGQRGHQHEIAERGVVGSALPTGAARFCALP
jgi:hypothetical protein